MPRFLPSGPSESRSWLRTSIAWWQKSCAATFGELVLRGDVLALVLAHHLGADVPADTRSLHGDKDVLLFALVLLHQPDELVAVDLGEDKLGVVLYFDLPQADGTQWRWSSAEAS